MGYQVSDTITADQTMSVLKDVIGRYKRFAIVKDDDRVIIEPLDEDDFKSYYALSRESEARLSESVRQASQGETHPVNSLFE